jgi:UTP--glucose-1-phosphate uridylyltransferase
VTATLDEELAALDPDTRAQLAANGFEASWLKERIAAARQASGTARADRNRLPGPARPPAPGDIPVAPEPGTPEHARLSAMGREPLARGDLAFVVMAGGMATRMGGVVKALVEALPGRTFLDLRLAERAHLSKKLGAELPLWIMTSDATDGPIRTALAAASSPPAVHTFRQGMSIRLTEDGHLFRNAAGKPGLHATGHGDLVDALVRSRLLPDFVAGGGSAGRLLWVTNLDNLGATVDPALLGLFLESGKKVQFEVVAKANDKGGIPIYAAGAASAGGADTLQVVEEFRLPKGFDPTTVPVFNTNTFLADARALAGAKVDWSYSEVEKKVDGRTAIQLERLIQDITRELPTGYVEVPREGPGSRFLPVKDPAELDTRRPAIEAALRARGIL